jgi:hypothetical protein
MSITLIFGLALQALAVSVVLLRLRGAWLGHPGAFFVILAAVYHGVGEVVQVLLPGRNRYRALVSQGNIDNWVLAAGVGLLVFAVTYAVVVRTAPTQNAGAPSAIKGLPAWWVCLLIAFPGYLLGLAGLGEAQVGYWVANITATLSTYGILLAAIGFVLRKGSRSLVFVLIAQSLALALLGYRGMVAVGTLIVLSVLATLGVRIKRRQLVTILVIAAGLMVAISGARAVLGRTDQNSNLAGGRARLVWLSSGIAAAGESTAVGGKVLNDFVYRIDGNAFPAMVLERQAEGYPLPGLRSLWQDVLLAVPRFMNPGKLATDETEREEKYFLIEHYDLPWEGGKQAVSYTQGIDYLPTTLGVMFSYYGFPSLIFGVVVLAVLFAGTERWAGRRRSLLSLFVSVALMLCVFRYEDGIKDFLLIPRDAAIPFALFSVLYVGAVVSRGMGTHRRATDGFAGEEATADSTRD